MGRVKQSIKYKYALNKNKQTRYKVVSSKYTYTNKTPSNTTKKYAYTKKVLVNGKYRYYYT